MDQTLITILISVFVPIVISGIAAAVSVYAARKQDKRQAVQDNDARAKQLNDMALQLIDPYKQEVAELRVKIEELECELLKEREKRRELEALNLQKDAKITEMQAEIDDLRSQIEALQKGRRH